MFDFSWTEIALIVVVALVAIGPKDLPVALKTVSQLIKKARGMAGEFQTHVNELMKEADLGDVRKQIDEIRHFDFKGEFERAVDPDQSIRKTFTEDPFATADAATTSAASAPEGETAVLEDPGRSPEPALAPAEPLTALPDAPSFVPPAVVVATLAPPSFVPPDLLSRRS
ncbi:MAG: Sec-independent protein translocase protein TatB [Acetobacteraceae bacterium]